MTSREKFEAWAKDNWMSLVYGDCDYVYSPTAWAWKAWQAAEADMAVQLANAEIKCMELAAENAHARERHIFIRALAVSILEHSGGRMDWRGAMEDATELLQTVDSVYAKTPATDAFLDEVRASARNDFIGRIEWIIRNECNPDKTEAIINELQNFSDELKLEAAQ